MMKKSILILLIFGLAFAGSVQAGEIIRTSKPTSILTGAYTTYTGTAQVSGSGTAMTTDLNVGDAIKINSVVYSVSAIGSATALTLDSAASVAGSYSAYCDKDLLTIYNGDSTSTFKIDKSGDVHGDGSYLLGFQNIPNLAAKGPGLLV